MSPEKQRKDVKEKEQMTNKMVNSKERKVLEEKKLKQKEKETKKVKK